MIMINTAWLRNDGRKHNDITFNAHRFIGDMLLHCWLVNLINVPLS